MNHIKRFNEKFGILTDLEEQVNKYYKEINENPKEDEFNFLYKCDVSHVFFKVIIQKKIDSDPGIGGQFSLLPNGSLIVYIKKSNRGNKDMLLHEVKHLDYYIRKKDFFKNVFFAANKRLSNLSKSPSVSVTREIFYVYDDNEFQSRYHGYYTMFDNYLKEHLKEKTKGEILTLFKKFLKETKDLSWTWYISDKVFRFEDYLEKDDMNKLLLYIEQDIDKPKISGGFFEFISKDLIQNIKIIYNKIFKKYTKKEMGIIEKNKKFFESHINKKRKIYTKKMYKIVSLMIDKYIK